ncbi:hypothetical protein LINPERHAP2_LOCUS10583, partial [Linum perenne]
MSKSLLRRTAASADNLHNLQLPSSIHISSSEMANLGGISRRRRRVFSRRMIPK